MKEAVSTSLMKKLDQYTIRNMGIPSLVLMERAALQVVREMEAVLETSRDKQRILCVCGGGNNGGDGIAIARILHLHGFRVDILLCRDAARMTEEARKQLEIAGNYQVPLVNNPDFHEYTTIVDAVFGVGLTRPVEGSCQKLIETMNHASAWKVAVDIPSGVNGDTGAVMGTAFRADLTVTFAFRKTGLCLYPGRRLAGRVVTADIGIYREDSLMEKKNCLQEQDLKLLPGRDPEGNKGTFGKVLAVAGSAGMCGASYFCGAAALACGAGMVRILTEEANRVPLQTLLPEAILEWGEDINVLEKVYAWCNALVMGPGLGTGESSRRKVQWFLERARQDRKPVILDADGLNLLAENPHWKKFLGLHTVLTPHMGEMSRLTGKSIRELQADREKAAMELSLETGAVCVLKDASTVTASPKGEVWFNLSGNPGMATAGSGDVLAGILAALFAGSCHSCCQNSAGLTAALGVFLHGKAGDLAAREKGEHGLKAGDLIPAVSAVRKYGGEHEKL